MWRWRQRFTSLVCHSSLVSLFFTSVTFCSSSKSLFPHFIDASTHSLYTWRMKCWIAFQSYFVVLIVLTCDIWNHDRLQWLLNRILSFSQSIHATYESMIDLNGFTIVVDRSRSPYTQCTKPWQTTASVGLAQDRPNYSTFIHGLVLSFICVCVCVCVCVCIIQGTSWIYVALL